MFRLSIFLPPRRSSERQFIRRVLAWIGPTWLASPWRRATQTIGLAFSLYLLFYVSWPYTARPAAHWSGWTPLEVDASSGRASLAPPAVGEEVASTNRPAVGQDIFVSTEVAGKTQSFGRFRVTAATAEAIVIEPRQTLDPAQLDQLSISLEAWSLDERDRSAWPSHYADDLARKETIAAESFLAIDPLVGLAASVASRSWVWSLGSALAILGVCLAIPRGFCGYVCPLGTTIDFFDAVIGRRTKRWHVAGRGWWSGARYVVLTAVLVAAVGGVMLGGFVAAMAIFTRTVALVLRLPVTGLNIGWHNVPPVGAGQWFSLALFAVVLGLGLLGPRFWCTYCCPTGAIFSLANTLRLTQRKVRQSCIACGNCAKICAFDAIRDDFSTRPLDCTFCQDCGGVCPVGAIEFVGRWAKLPERPRATDLPAEAGQGGASRRKFLAAAAGAGVGAIGGLGGVLAVRVPSVPTDQVVRAPGSLPEAMFLQTCIRCGACIQACPNDVLQPLGLQYGLDGLWTPYVAADWAGCEPSCANCGQVCPTGAIRALPLDEKRMARMGLAVVNLQTCLPHALREACQLCVDDCTAAGYQAIEFVRVGTELDDQGVPLEDSGFQAPIVVPDRCVGCGLCQSRCAAMNVRRKGLLAESAVIVAAGDGKDDRIARGSYRALREDEASRKQSQGSTKSSGGYLPDFLK